MRSEAGGDRKTGDTAPKDQEIRSFHSQELVDRPSFVTHPDAQ